MREHLVFPVATWLEAMPSLQERRTSVVALGRARNWRRALTEFAALSGLEPNTSLVNAAATAYTRGRWWPQALSLIQEMNRRLLVPNVVSLNAVATAFERGSQWQKAVKLLHGESGEPDIVTFSVSISAASRGAPQHVRLPVKLLAEAIGRRLLPDVIAFSSVISACGKGPQWEMALEVLQMLREQPGIQPNVVCFGAGITACAKGRHWQGAFALLDELRERALDPDLIAFNAAITACEKAQRWEFALELLMMMTSSHVVTPDIVSFNAAASACEKRSQWCWAL